MLFYVSVKSEAGGFLGACIVNAEEEQAANRAAVAIVQNFGHTCSFETLIHAIPPGEIPVPPMNRLLSYEELDVWFSGHGGLREVDTSTSDDQ